MRNPKFEILNTKQILNPKFQCPNEILHFVQGDKGRVQNDNFVVSLGPAKGGVEFRYCLDLNLLQGSA